MRPKCQREQRVALNARLLFLVALVVSGTGAFAQVRPRTVRTNPEVATASDQGTGSAQTTLSMRGTMEKYEASTGILSLSTPSGTLLFQVVPTTRIRQGWRERGRLDLQTLAGYRLTVRYSESAASRILQSIHVFGKDER
jgi:hypothetical protein